MLIEIESGLIRRVADVPMMAVAGEGVTSAFEDLGNIWAVGARRGADGEGSIVCIGFFCGALGLR